jgi:hypothetical protein
MIAETSDAPLRCARVRAARWVEPGHWRSSDVYYVSETLQLYGVESTLSHCR